MTAELWIAFFVGFLACYLVTAAAHAAVFWVERRYATKYPGKLPLSTDPRGRPRRIQHPEDCYLCRIARSGQ
jgi:hypothetical protein